MPIQPPIVGHSADSNVSDIQDAVVYRHPKLRRLLAGAIDLKLQMVFLMSIWPWIHVPYRFEIWALLLFMAIYYAVGNSYVTRGQTLGKLLCRLHVLDAKSIRSGHLGFLSLRKAFFRFVVLLGLPLLIIDRINGVSCPLGDCTYDEVAKSSFMLLYCYWMAMLCTVLVGKYGLGLHDWLVGSRVESKSLPVGDLPIGRLETTFFTGLAIGVVVGIILWVSGLSVHV